MNLDNIKYYNMDTEVFLRKVYNSNYTYLNYILKNSNSTSDHIINAYSSFLDTVRIILMVIDEENTSIRLLIQKDILKLDMKVNYRIEID